MSILKTTGTGSLNMSVPVYVTRQTADGVTGSYFLSLWMSLLVLLLVWLNAVVWGFLGLYFAVKVVF